MREVCQYKPKFPYVIPICNSQMYLFLTRKQIIKLFSSVYPHIQLRCIFRALQRLSSFFRFKDRIPLGLRSRVVCKFKCQCCDALYFGETIRHLHTRISEHLGISACTGKPLIINLLAILLILMIFLS